MVSADWEFYRPRDEREAIARVEMATNTRGDKFRPAPDGDRLLALKHHVIRKRRPEPEVCGEKRCIAETEEREEGGEVCKFHCPKVFTKSR